MRVSTVSALSKPKAFAFLWLAFYSAALKAKSYPIVSPDTWYSANSDQAVYFAP
jgi:hypothetical protein